MVRESDEVRGQRMEEALAAALAYAAASCLAVHVVAAPQHCRCDSSSRPMRALQRSPTRTLVCFRKKEAACWQRTVRRSPPGVPHAIRFSAGGIRCRLRRCSSR